MMTAEMGQVRTSPAQCPPTTEHMIHGVAPGPMPQQNAFDSHGYDMHPQMFVRLIGCHESSSDKPEPAPRLH